MGSMFGGVDVDAALSAAGLGGGGSGGGGGGSDDGADGALADMNKLLDDPALMSTLGGLASALTSLPITSGAGTTAAAAPADPSQPPAAAAARQDNSTNGKARASRQD